MRHLTLVTLSVVALSFGGAAPSRADDSTHRSLVLLGQSGQVHADQKVDAAIVIGGSLVVEGVVTGPAAAVGGDVEVRPSGAVSNGVYAIGGTLRIDEGADVQGPRTQVAAGEIGTVISQLSQREQQSEANPAGFWPIMRLAQVLAVLVIGLLLAALVPVPLQTVRRTLNEQPGRSALAGLGLLLGFVPLCVILAVSVLGIPLIPLALLALSACVVMGLSALAASIGFGLRLIKSPDNLLGATALGMSLIALAVLIPILGGLLWFLGSFYAAGAVLLSRFGTRAPEPPRRQVQRPQPEPGSAPASTPVS